MLWIIPELFLYVGGTLMSQVLSKLAKEYEKLRDKQYIYSLENGTSFTLIFENKRFAHLLGLHKIIDVPQLKKLADKKYSANKVFKEIKSGVISDDDIFNSCYFSEIENRYHYFHKIEDLIFEKAIIDFDRTKLYTKIKADILLYTIVDGLYIHLCLVRDKKNFLVPMTFIVHPTDLYVKGQDEINITNLYIKDKNGVEKTYIYLDEVAMTINNDKE